MDEQKQHFWYHDVAVSKVILLRENFYWKLSPSFYLSFLFYSAYFSLSFFLSGISFCFFLSGVSCLLFFKWAIPSLFFLYPCLLNRKQKICVHYEILPMTGFELQTSGIRDDYSANLATMTSVIGSIRYTNLATTTESSFSYFYFDLFLYYLFIAIYLLSFSVCLAACLSCHLHFLCREPTLCQLEVATFSHEKLGKQL